jgi:bifunctional DNase/RNase
MLLRSARIAFTLALAGCGGLDADSPREVAVRVGYVAMDPRSQSPVVVLEESEGERALPIWIGYAEARSIAAEIEHEPAPRPNTHDLAKRLIDGLEGNVERVVVTELREGTYFATLVLASRGKRVEIDSRPSDAIAIALRFDAPLYVRETLFETEQSEPTEEEASQAI